MIKLKSKVLWLLLAAGVLMAAGVLQAAGMPGGGNHETVSAGGWHSLAITDDGSLWAWGSNSAGELGDNTSTEKSNPVRILDGVSSVAAGSGHSLVIRTDGSLWAFGFNGNGQLGNGTILNRFSPMRIMDQAAYAAAGGWHSLVVLGDGSLWAFGSNAFGQLGDGSTTDRRSPVKIMDGVRSVSASAGHSIAVRNDGSLWAWGLNANGQLGDGTTVNRHSPVRITDDVESAAAGGGHSLAVKTDGSLWAWGFNSNGQLGDGSKTDRHRPVRIIGETGSVSAGMFHSLAIRTDGSLWAWGSNSMGRLGDGTVTAYGVGDVIISDHDKSVPVRIADGVSSVSAGGGHSIAVRTDGKLIAWGNNFSGQLGDGSTVDRHSPVETMAGVKQPAGTATREPEIKVIVNGEELSFDSPPVIENGRTLVPLRVIFEALGAEVDWDGGTRTVIAVIGDTVITLRIDDNVLYKNGDGIELDVPAKIIGGRTLVPARAVAESFGADVEWDQETRTVTINESI